MKLKNYRIGHVTKRNYQLGNWQRSTQFPTQHFTSESTLGLKVMATAQVAKARAVFCPKNMKVN